ncbi:type IV pilus assembly protein PilX [Novimethylophilus kurashikiensis]|uniref:Type IV pilus assembly protein PilX n=1 Tax=Novimethylophilus kurashikiensis TaxID=1825523 RepID=A0A2R5F1Z1_9PROT|nr:PilX N-terminal domain-containing pilus assembly protein [Novimethylophilus kurashikiensis]GBG12505.1 type IV pilus assembly protein PilX [Novimethylophilus kurashikiensis]
MNAHPCFRRQQGVTLVMSLIFLLMLSMIGLWSATNNSLQERMAGNSRNRDLALQSAEAALKYAENTTATWRTSVFDGTAKGLLTYDATLANDAAYWRDVTHWTNALQVPAGTVNQVAVQPYYMIEKMPSVGTVEYYRITAKGVGGESSSTVILQSIITYAP